MAASITALRRGTRVSDDLSSARALDAPQAWMQAIAAHRDRAAFAALHRHFAPRLASFLARSGGPTDVEELVQETMLAVWRKADSYNPAQAGVATWIFTIARNLRIDALRRAGRARPPEPAPLDDVDDAANGEALMLAGEREALVRQALGQLPPEQAEVVHLTYFTEQTQAEISRRLGVPLGTVKSRLRLAAKRLSVLLEPGR